MQQDAKPIYELFNEIPEGLDLLSMGPTQQCICGSTMFAAIVWYSPADPGEPSCSDDSRAVAGYFTEMKCVSCGALVHGATDDPSELEIGYGN